MKAKYKRVGISAVKQEGFGEWDRIILIFKRYFKKIKYAKPCWRSEGRRQKRGSFGWIEEKQKQKLVKGVPDSSPDLLIYEITASRVTL